MTAGTFHSSRSQQRGLTLFGLLFWALVIGFLAYVLVRVLPTINEYATIQRAVEKIAAAQPATVAEARQAFDKQRDLEYSISAITAKDLVVTKENDKVKIVHMFALKVQDFLPELNQNFIEPQEQTLLE